MPNVTSITQQRNKPLLERIDRLLKRRGVLGMADGADWLNSVIQALDEAGKRILEMEEEERRRLKDG